VARVLLPVPTVDRSSADRTRLRAAATLLAAALVAGAPGCTREPPPPHASFPEALPRAEGFGDTTDLLQSIEQGTFTERAEVEVPPAQLPKPVEIEFARGADVAADQLPKLRKLATALMSDSRPRVDLVGCSEAAGSEADSERISLARAQSVAAVLNELGLPASQLGEVMGRGEHCEIPEDVVIATSYVPETAEPNA
jgi:outer membrane protein OmpA-like peptidoglycan-associated protein